MMTDEEILDKWEKVLDFTSERCEPTKNRLLLGKSLEDFEQFCKDWNSSNVAKGLIPSIRVSQCPVIIEDIKDVNIFHTSKYSWDRNYIFVKATMSGSTLTAYYSALNTMCGEYIFDPNQVYEFPNETYIVYFPIMTKDFWDKISDVSHHCVMRKSIFLAEEFEELLVDKNDMF